MKVLLKETTQPSFINIYGFNAILKQIKMSWLLIKERGHDSKGQHYVDWGYIE